MYPVQKPDNQPWRVLSFVFLMLAFCWSAFCLSVMVRELNESPRVGWNAKAERWATIWGVPCIALASLSFACRPTPAD